MPPPSKPTNQRYSVTDWDENETPSNNLWVGNLASNVTDADLLTLFQKHGAIDSVTLYSTRCYAFVHFKRVEDAKDAREAIRGKVLRGNAMKIEFAKPAKPCRSLWVGGIGPSVSKEALEGHFVKFGKIEDLKFLRDRNTAFIDYFRLEDATQALKSMNGKRIGDGQIRVDFLRSQSSKREQLPDFRDAREGQFFNRSMGPIDTPWMPHGFKMNYSEPTHQIPNRQQHLQSLGGRKWDGQPSNVLCISYPPPLHIDEQMLHNAMILFGEIEMIRSFPSKHCSFVEFRSMDEARCAKDGLQGKLFNDPRISITYASNELAPNNDYHGFYPGINGPRPRPRPDIFINDAPFRPPQMDMFSHDHSIVPSSFPGYIPPRGIPRPDILMRPPLGPKSSFEPLLPGPEFSDSANRRVIHDMKPNPMSGPNWRRTSLAPEILSPPPRMERFTRPMPDTGDSFDSNQVQRESKRSRTDSALPAMGPSYSLKQMDEQGLDQLYGRGPQFDGGVLGPLANVQGKNRMSSAGTGFTTGGTAQGHPELDYEWRGLIAKGGTPVCRSRCVPIGEGIGSTIPEIVNCSARTGLDMLTKHYVDAVGFNIIFFLPDTEEDFAPYTEFLRYLGAKNRAGVAKLDDGTTLFLVPPSDFLTKVLNIKGPERLYGVVLKFPQHASSSSTLGPTPQSVQVQPQKIDSCNIPSFPSQPDYNFQYQKTEYNSMPPQEERVMQTVDEMGVSHVDSNLMLPATNTAAPISQAGLTLTPELIATLASLLPAKEKSSDAQLSSGLTAATFDRGQWTHEHNKSPEQTQTGHPQQQLGSQFNHPTQLVQQQQQQQQQAYMKISHTPHDFVQGTNNTQIQDPAFNMPQQDVASFRPSNNFASPSPSGPFAVSLQVNQQYNYELPQDTWNGYEVGHGPDSSGQYSASVLQPTTNPVPSSNQVQGHNIPLSHNVMPVTAENSNVGIPNQEQQLQSALYGGGQGALEVDKNERYRSTLQFAANLLLQIQQQPSGTQAGQGSGGH